MRIPTLTSIPDYSKKSVGRPRTDYSTALYEIKKKVGRPKKAEAEPATEKKKRGRPKTKPAPDPSIPKRPVGRPKKIKNEVPKPKPVEKPAPKSMPKPPVKSVPKPTPKINKADFIAFLEDETDYVAPVNYKNIAKASGDFLKEIGEDDEIFYKIMPEMKPVNVNVNVNPPPVAGGKQKMMTPKIVPKTERVATFVKKLEELPEDKKKKAIQTMKLVRMSTMEIINLIHKINPIAGTAGLNKQQLIEKYLKLLKIY